MSTRALKIMMSSKDQNFDWQYQMSMSIDSICSGCESHDVFEMR